MAKTYEQSVIGKVQGKGAPVPNPREALPPILSINQLNPSANPGNPIGVGSLRVGAKPFSLGGGR